METSAIAISTIAPLAWNEDRSERLGASSFICDLPEGKLRIGHHMKGDDLVRMRFTIAMEPEFSDFNVWKAARDALPRNSAEADRLNAMMLGNSEIGYFNTADDAKRLLEVARRGTSATVEAMLQETGFVAGQVLDYPDQGRTVALYLKRVKSGFFTIYIENGTNVHLTYEGRNALGHRNLLDVSFQETHGPGRFTTLFWPSFVTTQTAVLMAVTMVDDYVAQGRTGRLKRR